MAAELILVDADTVRPLRADGGLEVRHPADEHERAAHFAAKKGKRVLGVVSIVPDIRDEQAGRWRMVGLYVEPGERGAGLGAMLVRAAQAIAANRGGGLWCTADDEGSAGYLEKHAFAAGADGVLVATLEAPPPSDDDE